ncbi:MAG: trypsin-like peptidase domain-containing protein [Deltaproteobacteria bacterium]|nr:trypsin-like peptidase domain-containing protein [Deltaproteobacteria bacterium]
MTLENLVQECSVKVADGTGFFVAPGWILTCAHVVENLTADQINIHHKNIKGLSVKKILLFKEDPYDIAILECASGSSDYPCVYLDKIYSPGDPLWTFGYSDQFENGAPVSVETEGPTGDNPPLIKFKGGQIRPGLSGSPLLNKKTGNVCGMVSETLGKRYAVGGVGVQISTVLSIADNLETLQKEFHSRQKRWSDLRNKFLTPIDKDQRPKRLTAKLPIISPDKIIGRRDELEDLHQRLFDNKQVVLVNGLGGIGKTTLAQAYIGKYWEEYHHVAWFSLLSDDIPGDFLNTEAILDNLKIRTEGKDSKTIFIEILTRL